jgi:hypothetical protein
MFFTLPNSRVPVKPLYLKNWIFSLRGLIYLTPQIFKTKFRFLHLDVSTKILLKTSFLVLEVMEFVIQILHILLLLRLVNI